MKIRTINNRDLEQMMESNLKFHKTFSGWVKDGISKLDWCLVIDDGGEIVGRIVFGVYDGNLEILILKVQEQGLALTNQLIAEGLAKMHLEGFQEVGCHLYSDNAGFESYLESLKSNGFNITQEKKSFVWNKENKSISESTSRLTFKELGETGDEEFIRAIEKVTNGTLDRDDLDSIQEHGSSLAANKYFHLLKDIDYNPNWWKLGYSAENEFVGLIIPQRFTEKIGAINYIGVEPRQRGQGYARDLLTEGIRVLNEVGVEKIIADIDVNNHPLDKALSEQGFKMDCSMLVLKKR